MGSSFISRKSNYNDTSNLESGKISVDKWPGRNSGGGILSYDFDRNSYYAWIGHSSSRQFIIEFGGGGIVVTINGTSRSIYWSA